MTKLLRAVVLVASASFLLSACAQNISLDYNPKTTAEVKGSVAVNNLRYLKAHASDDNEIGCNRLECMHLTETVSDFVTNAVKREFRQAGLSLAKSQCTVSGEINEYSYAVNLFSLTFKTSIRYILSDGAGKVVFDNNYNVEFDAAGVQNTTLLLNNLNKALSDNIDKLLNDRGFQDSVLRSCQ